MALDDRSKPKGFPVTLNPVPANPQVQMQSTVPFQLIKPDQTSYAQSAGKADISKGPDNYGSPTKQ